MARLPRTGRSTSALYERTPAFEEMAKAGHVDSRECETTLADVISGLGLAPLSREDEQTIRGELGLIIGRGLKISEQSPKQNPNALMVEDVQATLIQVADLLDMSVARELDPDQFAAIDKIMKGAETGLHDSHDIEIALKIRSTLAQEIGLDASERMAEFHKWPRTIAEACRRAAEDLKLIRVSAGRQSREWYRDFRRVLTLVASKNGISPKVVINRRTHEARGRFIDLAEQFERLLPPHMRSPSREAIAKMLERSDA